jgi:hypothetical protein
MLRKKRQVFPKRIKVKNEKESILGYKES